MPDTDLTQRAFGVRCTTASGEDVLVTVEATNEPDAMSQVASHIRLFHGDGDAAGRWLASQNPDTLTMAHEAKPMEDWDD